MNRTFLWNLIASNLFWKWIETKEKIGIAKEHFWMKSRYFCENWSSCHNVKSNNKIYCSIYAISFRLNAIQSFLDSKLWPQRIVNRMIFHPTEFTLSILHLKHQNETNHLRIYLGCDRDILRLDLYLFNVCKIQMIVCVLISFGCDVLKFTIPEIQYAIVYITCFDVGLNYNDKYLQQIQWPHTMIRQIRQIERTLLFFTPLLYFLFFYFNAKRKWHRNRSISICEQNIYCFHCSHSLLLNWRQWHRNFMFVICYIFDVTFDEEILRSKQFQWLNEGKKSFIFCGFYINEPWSSLWTEMRIIS